VFQGSSVWGSLVETAIEGQSLTAEDKLFLLLQVGLYLMAMRGMGAPEARICFECAEPLCHLMNQPRLLFLVLGGQFRYTLMTANALTRWRRNRILEGLSGNFAVLHVEENGRTTWHTNFATAYFDLTGAFWKDDQ